jgi:cellobiose phosphorylase
MPERFDDLTIKREYRGATYNISLIRSKEKGLWADGKKVESGIIPAAPVDSVVNVVCSM